MTATPAAPTAPPTSDIERFHPLEIVPFFKRLRRPRPAIGQDLLYTFIWNCSLGLIFWSMSAMFRPRGLNAADFLGSLLVANSIGFTMHAIFFVTGRAGIDRWARGLGPVFTTAYFTLVSTVGVVVGFVLVALAFDAKALQWILQPRSLIVMGISSGVISIIIAVIAFSREREARAEATLERELLRIERAEREAALANLRALQAQIEPHFLFNTLANVTSLVDADPALAKRMLESFIRFLRSSLAATRMERTTLGEEAALIAAFLEVLLVRMGSRLRYRVDLAPELAGFELPPMLLQPLVENAIRHGLEPKVDGGEIVVSMRRQADEVVVEVSDTGVGFAPTTRGGLGLTNIRDRLRLIFGERATLAIGEQQPSGTRVTLRLPA